MPGDVLTVGGDVKIFRTPQQRDLQSSDDANFAGGTPSAYTRDAGNRRVLVDGNGRDCCCDGGGSSCEPVPCTATLGNPVAALGICRASGPFTCCVVADDTNQDCIPDGGVQPCSNQRSWRCCSIACASGATSIPQALITWPGGSRVFSDLWYQVALGSSGDRFSLTFRGVLLEPQNDRAYDVFVEYSDDVNWCLLENQINGLCFGTGDYTGVRPNDRCDLCFGTAFDPLIETCTHFADVRFREFSGDVAVIRRGDGACEIDVTSGTFLNQWDANRGSVNLSQTFDRKLYGDYPGQLNGAWSGLPLPVEWTFDSTVLYDFTLQKAWNNPTFNCGPQCF